MNLTELLRFLPLIIGAFLAYHLIFKQQLPAKNMGQIITYFIGTIIIFVAISWLITSFLAGWAVDLLDTGVTSTEWQLFMSTSEKVVEDAFSTEPLPEPQPTPIPAAPAVAPPNNNSSSGDSSSDGSSSLPDGTNAIIAGPAQYVVTTGDTLFGIATRFGVSVEAIMIANGLTSYIIQPDQVLIIPAPTQ